jgi:hypothetical protein
MIKYSKEDVMKKTLAGLLLSGCIHSTNPHPELFVHQEYTGRTDPAFVPGQTLVWEETSSVTVPVDLVGVILVQPVPVTGAETEPAVEATVVVPTENPPEQTIYPGFEMAEIDVP